MARITIRGTGGRPGTPFRPGVEQLEDRSVPSTLVTKQPVSNTGIDPNSGLDASAQVLGSTADGNYVLIQSQATNFVLGQVSPPGQTNLFVLDKNAQQTYLISSYDTSFVPGVSGGSTLSKSLGVVPSIVNPNVGQSVQYNAVISEGALNGVGAGGGSGVSVAFLSTADAYYFDPTLPNGVSSDGGGADVFVWSLDTQKVTLASRTANSQALGQFGQVSNPSISADGTTVSFVSSASINEVVTQTVVPLPAATANGSNVTLVGISSGGQALATVPDFAIRDDAGGPDLFRAVVGQTPVPVSYHPVTVTARYSETVTAGNVGTVQFFTVVSTRFVMDGDVAVDPLNRYATIGEAGYAVVRTTDNDVYRLQFNQTQLTALLGGDVVTDTSSPEVLANPTTAGTSAGAAGTGVAGNAIIARVSGDIFFTYQATAAAGALVTGYTNGNGGGYDLYQSSSAAGGTKGRLVTLASAAAGTAAQGGNGILDLDPRAYQVTDDGTKLLYTSKATNLVAGLTDTNAAFDIFQRDLTTALNTAISVTTSNPNLTGNGASQYPTQTPDSLVVGYQSAATNLTAVPDTNNGTDVFVRDMVAGDTLVASALDGNTGTGNAASFGILVTRTSQVDTSFYRRFLAYFSSNATNLDTGSPALPVGGQVYTQQFPIFISQQPRVVSYSGGTAGYVAISTTDTKGNLITINQFQPFPGYTGELRVATGDVNGDGTPDIIVGAGPGAGPRVKIIDGYTGRTLDDFFAYEPSFTGGVYVAAADMNGDGKADVILGAGEGGGPRVQIYSSDTGILLFDQFVFEASSRAGVRPAAGDINGDGVPDLVVAAGTGGGPRVRVIDGTSFNTGGKILADFFAFESGLRGGVYPSVGDYNGDGIADIAVGSGPGGGPRVAVFNGANLTTGDPNQPVKFVDFFAFPLGSTDGARPVIRNVNGNKFAALIVGSGSGLPRVRTFLGNVPTADGGLQQVQEIIPFNSLVGTYGAYVG